MFDEDSPNAVHQADLLYLPHDRVGRRTYKYALTVVDVASRYKEAGPLTDKSATEVATALGRIYKRGPLTWPRLLQVDPGREFMGAVSQLLAKHNVQVQRGAADNHRQQGIVERFNRTLAERLFGAQYAQELLLAARESFERSVEWVARLHAVVVALNGEVTWLTGKKPSEAIKERSVAQSPPPLFLALTNLCYLLTLSSVICSFYDFLQLVGTQGKVQTVGVHLDQFKVFAINKAVK